MLGENNLNTFLNQAKQSVQDDLSSAITLPQIRELDSLFNIFSEKILEFKKRVEGTSREGFTPLLIGKSETLIQEKGKLPRKFRLYENMCSIHVLIVDDDSVTLNTLEVQCQRFGLKTTTCDGGEAAVSYLTKHPDDVDFVLLDVNMPRMNGIQVLQNILTSTRYNDLPVLMISGDYNQKVAESCVNEGAKEYLVKPVKPSAFADIGAKLRCWHQSDSRLRYSSLRNFCSVSQSLAIHAKFTLRPSDWEDEQSVQSEPQASMVKDMRTDSMKVDCLSIVSATESMLKVFGLSNAQLLNSSFDLRSFIEHADLKEFEDCIVQIRLPSVTGDAPTPVAAHTLNWRWKHHDGSIVPVSGTLIYLGDNELLIESKSILPKLLLQREKVLRELVEEELVGSRLASQKVDLFKQELQKRENLVWKEAVQLIQPLKLFALIVESNPNVLSWRIEVETGKVQFVSDQACRNILEAEPVHVMCSNHEAYLVDEEDKLRFNKFMNELGSDERYKRISKSGKIHQVHSFHLGWWGEQEKPDALIAEILVQQ